MIIRIGLIVLVVPCMILMVAYIYEVSAINACVQAGGSYDYAASLCDYVNKHRAIAFLARYSLGVNLGMLVSVIGLVCCLIGLYKRPAG